MPYPEKYTRQYGFQNYQEANPTRPLPGDKVDADLNRAALSSGQIVDFLRGFSRSDGRLANASVGLDQLTPAVKAALGLTDIEELIAEAVENIPLLAPNITFTPAGTVAATNVQAAIEELATDYVAAIAAEAVLRTAADALKADVTSPTFLGAPLAPTPAFGDDSTQIATTAFVQDAVAGSAGAFFVTPESFNAVGDGVADDTSALQAAFDAGNWIKGDPTKIYRISESLIRTTGDFILEDVHLYGAAADFDNTDTGSPKYGTTGCFLYVHGELAADFTPLADFAIRRCKFQSEVADGRCLTAIGIHNATDGVIEECEIWDFPCAMGIRANSLARVHMRRNYIHDFFFDDDTLTGAVQSTGIEIDNDRTNSISSIDCEIVGNHIEDLEFGATAEAEYGYQTDGINNNGNNLLRFLVSGNLVRNVGDGIDWFGDDSQLVGNRIFDTIIGIKVIHGACRNHIADNLIQRADWYGIGVFGNGANGHVDGNTIVDNTVLDIDPTGDNVGVTATACIALDGNSVASKIKNTLVAGNHLDAGANGLYNIRRINDGDHNIYIDNDIIRAGTAGIVQAGTETNSYYRPAVLTTADATVERGRLAAAGISDANSFQNQQAITHTNAGGGSFPLVLKNASSTAGTECGLDLNPSANGPGVRSAQVVAVQEGSNVIRLSLRASGSGGVPPLEVAYCRNGMVVGNPTGGDPGAGNINAKDVLNDNVSLTCFALQEEFVKSRTIDLAKWDAMVPDDVQPARIVSEPVMDLMPIFSATGEGLDAIEVPLIEEYEEEELVPDEQAGGLIARNLRKHRQVRRLIVIPEKATPRRNEVAHLFKRMVDDGFDPLAPGAYRTKLLGDQGLPGMPLQGEWQHNRMGTGELFCRLWLATELLALAHLQLEERVAVLEAAA